MIKLRFSAHVDETRCAGCRLCERVCPSGAIRVEGSTASVDSERCIDCQRCIDRCSSEGAIARAPRGSVVTRWVDSADVDQARLRALCERAGVLPDLPICGCTRTTGREAFAAVLKGAKTPEDLCATTGLRAGCGLYCATRIFQVLDACGIPLEEPPDRRWLKLTLSLGDIPGKTVDAIDRDYPQCYVGEDWRRLQGRRGDRAAKGDKDG